MSNESSLEFTPTPKEECTECKVEAQLLGVGSASKRLAWQCPRCNRQWFGKNPAAMALGAMGGKKAAENMTPEERRERSQKGVRARLSKLQ